MFTNISTNSAPSVAQLNRQTDEARWAQDGRWVELARGRETQAGHNAFRRLVERYQGYVRNLLFGLCQHHDLADELAQETFVISWQKLSHLNDPAKFQGWIKQLAYRQFLHHQRHQKIVDAHQERVQSQDKDALVADLAAPDWQRLLKPCNELERELLVLLFSFEFTYAEIGELRDMPVGTVKSHVHRAKAKIGRMLEENS